MCVKAAVTFWNQIQIKMPTRLLKNVGILKIFSRLYSNENIIKTIISSNLESLPKPCTAKGWVCGLRKHKEIMFLDISDGTCNGKLQVILPTEIIHFESISFGDAISVTGQLKPSSHPKQILELVGDSITVHGNCPTEEFPLKLRQIYPIDQLRYEPHIRPKHKIFNSMLRVRSMAAQEVHNFFQFQDFTYVHAPVLTSNDCEGAGDVFSVQSANKKFENISKNKHFFDKPVHLTVSSQLHLESAASAIKRVYSFGPTFRAENTKTRQHLSEFHMIEIEEAFITKVETLIELTESLVKHVGKAIFEKCSADIDELHKECAPKNYVQYVKLALEKKFQRLTYSEAVDILQGCKFQNSIRWGDDLLAEHEQYLIRHFQNVPVIVTHYPAAIKPFYMKTSEQNGQLIAENFDVLVPLGGELCGGSLREDNYQVLRQRLEENKINELLKWYLDLRKFGGAPHGGFGLGFDRLLQYLLGIKHIRDVVPYPRWTHHCMM